MRLVFLGTPSFAVPSLERILEAGHEVLAVYTQPDRPKGRGREVAASPIKQAALRHALPLRQPARVKQPDVVAELAGLHPEAMVIVGFGQLIPQAIIDIAPLGIINVHASLLPAYRGAAPIQWAIARGESTTGVTTMRISAGLDTGDILLQRATHIGPGETAVELAERLAAIGAELLVETLTGLQAGVVLPKKQDDTLASHAPMLHKEDGLIDWSLTAREIYNKVRGFMPWPGAFSWFRGQRLNVWAARIAEASAQLQPGSLQAAGRRLLVSCGAGTGLELLELQLEGKKKIAAEAFMNGQHVMPGETLGEEKK